MVTIRDVAKLAGVGLGTASRALAGNSSVASDTRTAVQNAANMLNYRPSSIARALSTRQSGMLGVLTPSFTGAYFSTALKVAEREIRAAGKHLVIVSSIDRGNAQWADAQGLAFLNDRDCDGILMLGTQLNERELIMAAESNPALALMNRELKSLEQNCFSVDHREAGRKVASYLLGQGHRSFGAITGALELEDARLRQEGFAETLASAGLPLDPRLVVDGDYSLEGGAAGASSLLATGLDFTAVFCGNDETAISARARFAEAGKTPRLFGYDDAGVLRFAGLDISSVSVPIDDIVSNACAFLLNRCYGGERPVLHRFETELVVRGN